MELLRGFTLLATLCGPISVGCGDPDGLHLRSRPTPVTGTQDWILSVRDGGRGRIARLTSSGSLTRLTSEGDAFDPWTTKDGRHVVFAKEADDFTSEIWEMAIDGSAARRIVGAEARAEFPVLTCDSVVFARGVTHRVTSTLGETWRDWDLIQIPRHGGTPAQITHRKFRRIDGLDVMPDGRLLITTQVTDAVKSSDAWRGHALHVMSLSSGELVDVGELGDSSATASRTGQIAFIRDVGQYNYEVFVMNADGTARRRVTSLSSYLSAPYFSTDGTTLAVLSDPRRRRHFQLLSVDLQGGRAARVSVGRPQ